MSDLIGSGYDLIGTRDSTASPGTTEFYNTQSGLGFENPQMLANFVQSQYQNPTVNASNVFDVLKQGFTPTQQTLTPTVNANQAVTAFDGTKSAQLAGQVNSLPTLDSLLLDAQNYRNQILGLTTPGQDELAARQSLNQANNTLRNFDVSTEGGIQKIMNKPIALEFQQGQEAALTRDAAFTRSSLTREVDVATQQLQTLQQARQDLLAKLNTAYGFGQDDIATKLKLDEITRTEQAQAKQFALENQVQSLFYRVGGTIYRTSDGKAYSTPEQFWADGGAKDFSNAPVVNGQSQQEKQIVIDLATKYPDAGISLTDSLASAQQKLTSSRIYQEQFYHPSTGSGSTSDKVTEAESSSKATQYLDMNKGNDGKVSPEVWQLALNAWLDDNHTAAEFVSRFGNYVNKSYEGWKDNYTGF